MLNGGAREAATFEAAILFPRTRACAALCATRRRWSIAGSTTLEWLRGRDAPLQCAATGGDSLASPGLILHELCSGNAGGR